MSGWVLQTATFYVCRSGIVFDEVALAGAGEQTLAAIGDDHGLYVAFVAAVTGAGAGYVYFSTDFQRVAGPAATHRAVRAAHFQCPLVVAAVGVFHFHVGIGVRV